MRKVKKARPYSRVGYNHDYDSKKSKFAVRDKRSYCRLILMIPVYFIC